MVKILSKSGESLADIYDVAGSVAGIEQLETRELPIVHEMGATVMSERFTTRIFRITTGAILQSIAFNVEEVNLPGTPARLLGIQVITTAVARVSRCAVLGTDPTLGQDFPLWVFDTTAGLGELVTMEDAGASANQDILIPRAGLNVFPAFVGGTAQQDSMVSSVTLAGTTPAFGAGTVTTTALLYIAFPRGAANISGVGLPIPSW